MRSGVRKLEVWYDLESLILVKTDHKMKPFPLRPGQIVPLLAVLNALPLDLLLSVIGSLPISSSLASLPSVA